MKKIKSKFQKVLLISIVLIIIILIFGYDKQVLSKLPYPYIQKPIFQYYLEITPSSAEMTDLIALLLSFILGFTCFIFFIIKRNNRRPYFMYTLSFIAIFFLSGYIGFTRNNYYSSKIENQYQKEITQINFDRIRKIGRLKPREKKWIIYEIKFPVDVGETWHMIDYKHENIRLRMDNATVEFKKLFIIPHDNNNLGPVREYEEGVNYY